MNVDISKKQFNILLKMAYLACRNLDDVGLFYHPENEAKDFYEMEEYLYSLSEKFGINVNDEGIPEEVFESETLGFRNMHEFLNEVDKEQLFEGLIKYFSYSDLLEKYSDEDLAAKNGNDISKEVMTLRQRYEVEFEKNGLDNLQINGLEEML